MRDWACGGQQATVRRSCMVAPSLNSMRILDLHADKSAADVCRTVGVSRRRLFSYLAQVRGQQDAEAWNEVSAYQCLICIC